MDGDLASLFSASPSLEDNCVRYDLFLTRPRISPAASATAPSAQNVVDPSLSAAQEAEDLAEAERMRDALLSLAAQQTRGFLWHRHGFHLSIRALPDPIRRVHGLHSFFLTGETSVGAAIMDEWVVARLIQTLSQRHESLIARLSDSDGEFLLIEAAEALPDWVTPDNTAQRVLVHSGRVHIHRPSDTKQRPPTPNASFEALADALDAMSTALGSPDAINRSFEAGDAIQTALATKLEQETTAYMADNRHQARCLLPRRAARILRALPTLVAPAVEAFYYRDPTRAGLICSRMALVGVGKAVETRVTFSRAMYAMLKQQNFHPPKPFVSGPGSRYHALLSTSSNPTRRSAADLGVKLACGLELLYSTEDACDQLGNRYKDLIDAVLARDDVSEVAEDGDELVDDDDGWMAVSPDALEEQLAGLERRLGGRNSDEEEEGGADELQQVAGMFSAFLGRESGVDGIQGAGPVQLDVAGLMDILNEARGDQDASDSDGEADRDEEDEAMAEAMAEMEAELADSTLVKSFVRPEGEQEEEEERKPHVTPETPLDLDFNLLSSLLESFASQDGQSGPVSNILGELRLPRAAKPAEASTLTVSETPTNN